MLRQVVWKKNWGAKKFISLARKLKKSGYQAVFAVSMAEHQQWQAIVNNEFPLPEFHNIKNYVDFLYESQAFIGNDSGGGHVASMLAIPVLTIVSSRKKTHFKWRPGWGRNSVIAGSLAVKFNGQRHWQYFLSVKNVFQALMNLVNKAS